jgi:pSer/pThr/pTyr-binding forkhead associated (FHA) protein
MPKLVFLDKNFGGQSYELVLGETTVGRLDSNILVIPDPSVSERHCLILTHGFEVIVRDSESRNGTFINGTRIHGQSQIKAGQTVTFGAVQARLELEAPTDQDDQPETALVSLKEIMSEQRRAAKNPKPDPARKLESTAPSECEGHTVLIRRDPALLAPLELSEQPSSAEKSPAGHFNRYVLWIAIGIVAALGLILWRVWGGK